MDEIQTINNEINNLISNQITLIQTGLLRVSQITLKLEEFEFELQKNFDRSLEQYIEISDRYLYHEGGIIDVVKENAKIELNRLNKIKDLKNRWNVWMNDIFSYH
jgi:hypothetical protein